MNNNRTTILTLIFMVFLGIFSISVSSASDRDFLPPRKGCQIVEHQNYILCFNRKYKDALWVSYELTDGELAKNFKRTNDFKPDNMIQSATLADYSHSGYDRGHLAPAGDMEFSKRAIHESFYLSNMTPQLPRFNRGIWKNLESQVRVWARNSHKIHIITAGILQGDKYIGPDHVLVPNLFYKIIYAPQQNKAIAFLLPNKASSQPLTHFIVPIKTINQLTHVNFFSNLSDQQINTPANPKLWSWTKHSSGHYKKRNFIKVNATQMNNTPTSTAKIIKMSRSHICHNPNDKYYNRTTHFTPYNSIQACLNAGGRLPRG